jgi:hypothetical protein
MRTNWVRLTGFTVVLCAVPFAVGQPGPGSGSGTGDATKAEQPGNDKKPQKTKLEEMLEEALQHNPDIRVAESKLREAEAELNRARLLVTQKVVTLNASLEAARAAVTVAEARVKRLQGMRNVVGPEEIDAALATFQQAKADLAKLEAEAPYITGQPPKDPNVDPAVERGLEWLRKVRQMEDDRNQAERDLRQARYAAALALAHRAWEAENLGLGSKVEVDKPAADRVRAALNKPVTLELQQRKKLPFALGLIVSVAPDVPIHVKGVVDWENWDTVAPATFKDVPLYVVLQWFEDVMPHHRAYVRDYGVLYLSDDVRPPAGAVPLREFLKAGKAEAKDEPKKE